MMRSTFFLTMTVLLANISVASEKLSSLQIKLRFDDSVHAEKITGRIYIAIARVGEGTADPIYQTGQTGTPLFGRDVEQLAPGEWAVIDNSVFGHPIASIEDLPAGEYLIQGFVNVYTRCERADGHTVYVHLDQGEGQDWRRSPGNLFSKPVMAKIDGSTQSIELNCDQIVPPISPNPDSKYVKRIRFQSEKLSAWWGQPIYLGATVLLPFGYEDHPEVRYPVNYIQGHYSNAAPGGFDRPSDFKARWLSAERQSRFIFVTFQHPTPYYDDSYGVNSANNGPFGDAIMEELIPAVESKFRIINEPWARQLSGGSTGGWISLAMQVFHPDFFGGCWASAPDSPDFRYHQLIDIYEDDNAYFLDQGWMRVERPARRRTDGNIDVMMKDENHFELVAGENSRSGGQWDIWEATFGPCGADGYPQRIWDKRTGKIDHTVANYWRDNYDLRHLIEKEWSTLGSKLSGKLHLYCGDMDNFYLNNGLRKLEAFLLGADQPKFEGVIEFKPLERHVWGPTGVELLELLDAHLRSSAPEAANLEQWHY